MSAADASLADWLALREQPDWTARSSALVDAVAAHLPSSRPVSVLDLATGTGSNLRYLLPRLPSPQRWLLVDRSPHLLALVRDRTRAWSAAHGHRMMDSANGFRVEGTDLSAEVETRTADLDLPLDEQLFAGRDLVTAAALLDLVSAAWLRALAAACRSAGASVLFALSYDGRTSFQPEDPDDGLARDLLNAHQRRDKGLGGPAAGPDAHRVAVACFADAGYRCRAEPTDWIVGPEAAAFQQQLAEGLAGAGLEQSPAERARLEAWLARRSAWIAAGQSRAAVGHRDMAGWLEPDR